MNNDLLEKELNYSLKNEFNLFNQKISIAPINIIVGNLNNYVPHLINKQADKFNQDIHIVGDEYFNFEDNEFDVSYYWNQWLNRYQHLIIKGHRRLFVILNSIDNSLKMIEIILKRIKILIKNYPLDTRISYDLLKIHWLYKFKNKPFGYEEINKFDFYKNFNIIKYESNKDRNTLELNYL